MIKLDAMFTGVVLLAVAGIALIVLKALGIVSISWELAVMPFVISAISWGIAVFISVFKYLSNK